MKIFKFIGMICLILGASFIGTGIFFNMSEKEFIKESIKTEATIANIKTENKDGKQNTYPYVKYTSEKKNKNGEIEKTEHYQKILYYDSDMKIGDKIVVYYKEGKPEKIKVTEHGEHIQEESFKIGGLMAIGGAFLLVLPSKKEKRKRSYY